MPCFDDGSIELPSEELVDRRACWSPERTGDIKMSQFQSHFSPGHLMIDTVSSVPNRSLRGLRRKVSASWTFIFTLRMTSLVEVL